jgi:hypothetical protein
MHLEALSRYRFSAAKRRDLSLVWKVLVDDYFSRWVKATDAVLDYGAGSCHFINNVRAWRRVACNLKPAVRQHCAHGVEFVVGANPAALSGQKFDIIFISNLPEHPENAQEVIDLLGGLRDLLTENGSLLILQPNLALVGRRHFDFIDHKTVLTDRSLDEALVLAGGGIASKTIRFLRYASKSPLAKAPRLVRADLRVPLADCFLGRQTSVVTRPRAAAAAAQS